MVLLAIMAKPRIMLVSSKFPPEYAGSGHRVFKTHQRLNASGVVSTQVLCGSMEFNTNASYEFGGLPVRRIASKIFPRVAPTQRRFSLYRLKSAVDFFLETTQVLFFLWKRRPQFDVLHVAGNNLVTSAALLFSKLTKVPTAVEVVNITSKSPLPMEPGWMRWLVRPGFPSHAKVICISDNVRDRCLEAGVPAQQLITRPNPIDENKFFPNPGRKEHYRSRLTPFGQGDVVLFYLAKFIPRKNHGFLIDVLRELPTSFKLVLAGPRVSSGPFFERDQRCFQSLREKIELHGLASRVTLVDEFIADPQEYLWASDLMVFPAEDEAFGTPFVEALACGIPVVTNHIEGVFDRYVRSGENGYTSPLEVGSWVRSIEAAVSKLSYDQRLSNAQSILRLAGSSKNDEEYQQVFEELKTHQAISN